MLQFVFRIGPLERQGQIESAYFVYPGRENAEVFFAALPDDAATAIAGAFPSAVLRCEPELAAAGFGAMAAAEWTDERRHILGVTALDMVSQETFAEIANEGLIFQFRRAAAAFWAAAPWNRDTGKKLQCLSMIEPSHGTFIGAVLGAGGKEYGLAIYPHRDHAEVAAECIDLGLEGLAATIDTVGMVFLAEPAYGVDAIRRAHGLSRIPLPVCTAEGLRSPIRDPQLALLTAALFALAAVPEVGEACSGQVAVGDIRCQVVAGGPIID